MSDPENQVAQHDVVHYSGKVDLRDLVIPGRRAHSTPDPDSDPDADPPRPGPNPDDVPPPANAPVREPTLPEPPIRTRPALML
jgi:hypothetical protein